MDKIQKISKYMSFFLIIIMFSSLCLLFFPWVFMEIDFVKQTILFSNKLIDTPEGLILFSSIKWTLLSKFLGFVSALFIVIPSFFKLMFLHKIFKNYQKGEIFNIINAKYYNFIGWLFFLDALLLRPLSEGFEVMMATISNEKGHRAFSLSLGTPNLESIFYGIIVIVISLIMKEASKLNDDQSLTI